jgi:hypothetical protein
MSNEFIVKNGLIVGGNVVTSGTITINGALAATQSWVTSQGYLTSASLSGYATQSYVTSAIAALVDSAPAALDTLNELAAALGDDANFSTTITNSIASKLPLAGGTLTGALLMGSGVTAAGNNQPTALSYGLLQGFGTFTLAADTDGSQSEFAIITAGYGVASATAANGLAIGFNTLTWKNNTVWHAGNLTNLNQLTNGPGYLTSYTETDTLASVTGRGATTSTNISVNSISIGTDATYGGVYRSVSFGYNGDGSNRIFAANNTSDGMYFAAATGQGFNFRPNGGTANLIVINSSGSLGIGTSSPSAPLAFGKAVYGAPSSDDFYRIKFEDVGGIHNDIGIGQPVSGSLGFNVAANGYISFNEGTNGERVRIAAGGNVGIGTTDPTSQMSGTFGIGIYNASYPAVGFKNSTTAWLWYGQSSTFKMWNVTAGDILTANTSGNIGIGTTTPSTKLDVSGVISATGGNSTNWNTAYGWGNHASAGYVTSSGSVNYANSAGYAATAGALTSMNISQFTNNSGYVAYGNYSWTSPVFGQYGIKSNLIDNVLYSAADRFEVFKDGVAWNTNCVFNLNYDQSCDVIPTSTSRTYSIVLNTKGNGSSGITYTEGNVYLSFYYVYIPASVSGRVRFQNGTWVNISGWTNVANNASYAVWRGNVPGGNYMVEIEITINSGSSVDTWFAQWEYVMGRPGQYELGIINKAQDNSLWRNMYFRDSSNNVQVSIGASGLSTSQNLHISGTSALYFPSYGGGFYMQDSSWIRTVNYKSIWTQTGLLGTDGGLTVGYGGATPPSGGAIIAGNVGIGTTSPGYKLEVNGTFGVNSDATFNGTNTYINSSVIVVGNNSTDIVGISGNTMYFPGNGNVGIGTTNPGTKLHVVGNAWINRPSNKVDNSGCTELPSRVEFNNAFASGQSGYMIFRYPTYNNFLISGDYDGNIGGAIPNIQFGRQSTVYMHINSSDGNIGIGTTSPTQKLHIVGTGASNDGITIQNTNASGNSQLRFLNTSGTERAAITYVNGADAVYHYTAGGGNLLNLVGANVGIGTTGPGSKLSILGNNDVLSVTSQTGDTSLPTKMLAQYVGLFNNGSNGHHLYINSSQELGSAEFNITKTWGGYLTFGVSGDGTARTRALYVNGNGYVGVNVNPVSGDRFEVAGSVRIHTGNNWDAIQIYSDGANGYIQGLGDETGLRIRSEYGNILLADNRGKVGIGIASPTALFHVANSGRMLGVLRIQGTNRTSFYDDTFAVNNDGGGADGFIYGSNVGGSFPFDGYGEVIIQANPRTGYSNGISLVTGTTSPSIKVRVTEAGNVGIGTSTPQVKLDVNGALGIVGSNFIYFGHTTGNIGAWTTRQYSNGSTHTFNAQTFIFNNEGYGSYQHMALTANGVNLRGKNTIDSTDSWLRLNQSGDYGSGVYTPGLMRADGGFQVSGSTVWHAGNDGSGSGLDADLLDGYHETSFIRIAANSSLPTNASFAIGSASGRNFIQSHSGQPLDLNPLGNAVTVSSSLSVSGDVTGSNLNVSNWNTAYSWGNHASAGYATTSYVTTQINNLIAGAPGALDTLDELAAALGDDSNFATTVTNSIAGKVSKSGDTMTGALTLNAGLNAYASPIYVNEIRFRDTAGSPASDPYSMRWISEASARGAGSSWLEFQLNDDSGEEIRIYGNSCVGYGCGSVSENLYHVFRADGYAWHAGNLVVVGTISASGYNSGNWDTAYGWGNHASAGYALNSALANYLPLSGGSIGGALTVNGNLTVNGTITENSSIKLKENVETSEGNLEKVVNLRPVTYNKIGSQTTELGLIAEEVAEVYPEFVQYDENGEPIGVHYSRLTAALIGAVKELTNQVQELNKKING